MTFVPEFVVAEGDLDAAAARKILAVVGALPVEWRPHISGSNQRFWMDAKRYNEAARTKRLRVAGFADLERIDACAGALIAEHFPGGVAATFRLRLAARMLEDWLLADHNAVAKFLELPVVVVEKEVRAGSAHPKTVLVNLARKSRRREVRDELVPEPGSRGLVGPGYTVTVRRYIEDFWNPVAAAQRSESMRRALDALRGSSP